MVLIMLAKEQAVFCKSGKMSGTRLVRRYNPGIFIQKAPDDTTLKPRPIDRAEIRQSGMGLLWTLRNTMMICQILSGNPHSEQAKFPRPVPRGDTGSTRWERQEQKKVHEARPSSLRIKASRKKSPCISCAFFIFAKDPYIMNKYMMKGGQEIETETRCAWKKLHTQYRTKLLMQCSRRTCRESGRRFDSVTTTHPLK